MSQLQGLASGAAAALPLYAIRPAALDGFLARLSAPVAAFLRAQGFTAAAGKLHLLPGEAGLAGAVLGLGAEESLFVFGGLAAALPPESIWRIETEKFDRDDATLGFLLGAYAYDRLKPAGQSRARLREADAGVRPIAIAQSICFARDLINTPPNLLGPEQLGDAAAALAGAFGATIERVKGAALRGRFPALHAVGAGSDRPPEAVVFSWQGTTASASAPLISLCGKGVCFDTGGYDLKPGAGMLRMKKDMGGAAILLGLAQLVMTFDLPLRLQVRIGCVENSVSGHAMRPSDVLETHAGLSVEIGNTDAEGRLVLCDLLAEAAAEAPDLLLDAATLTGAARVALGPDLPALFSNDEALAEKIIEAGKAVGDPLWRLPLWQGYNSWLDSNIADVNNVSAKPFAGAIIAALFLKRFVPDGIPWAHIDVYGWNDQSRPGRPEGGEAQTLRALFFMLESLANTNLRKKE
jgi:leucyl aminopeptidase